MCRRSRRWLSALVLSAPAWLGIGSAASADDVAAFLELHGLRQLLAVHLEQQLEVAKSADERAELIAKLAGLYAELLESATDPAQRITLEESSRRLLAQAPPNSADELRLALLRASYRSAEKIAENHRLRMSSPQDVESAKQTFAQIAPQLSALRQQIRQSVEAVDRRASRATGTEAVALSESVERARSL